MLSQIREALQACEENLRIIHRANGKKHEGSLGSCTCTFEAWKKAKEALDAMDALEHDITVLGLLERIAMEPCRNDKKNPCWDDRPEDIVGQHWGEHDEVAGRSYRPQACDPCTARGILRAVKEGTRLFPIQFMLLCEHEYNPTDSDKWEEYILFTRQFSNRKPGNNWAVRQGNLCLNNEDLEWDEDVCDDTHRFDTLEAAIAAYRARMKKEGLL